MTFLKTKINGRWELELPEYRIQRLDWDWWEKERLLAMYCAIREGDTIIDVGSEEGDLSALFAKWAGQTGEIILIEPTKAFWPNIKSIFEVNHLKPPLYSFVGFASDLSFHDKKQGQLIEGWPEEVKGEITPEAGFCHLSEQPDIPQITLDQIYEKIKKINIITMDTEGSEYHILLGAKKLLNEQNPIVFISIHPEKLRADYKMTLDDVVTHMKLMGYQGTYLCYDHESHWMFKK